MPLPADFDLDGFRPPVLAEDLGTGGDVTSNATIAADARFTAEMNCRAADRRRRPGDRRGLLPRARPRRRDRALRRGRRPGRTRQRADAARRAMPARCSPPSAPALNTLQHLSGIATLTRALCRRDRRHRRDPARHAQDHSRPARARKICGADGRRAEPPHAARRRGADQGQSCRRVRRRRRGGAPRQGGEHRACRSRSRSTASTRSSRRWPPAPTVCCSTICRRRCCAKRSRWSPAACRSKRRAASALETIRAIAETGVDFISAGRITQSAPAVDIGLDYAMNR